MTDVIDDAPLLDIDTAARKPYPGFTDVDFRDAPPTLNGTERQAPRALGHVYEAAGQHPMRHITHAHPHCPLCQVEDHPETSREDAKRICQDRATWYLQTHRDQMPADPAPEQWLAIAVPATGNSLEADLLDRDELDQLPEPEPIIDDVLMAHSIIVVSGRHGTKKSLIAQSWAASLAAGVQWLGQSTRPCRVLYVAGEGANGLRARFDAWEEAWQTRIPAGRLTVLRRAVNLYRGGPDLDALEQVVANGGYGLVIVDTLRRSSSGADENSARDMGLVIDALERIKRATDDGSVVLIAHTDKGDNGTRGSSAIEDDADIVWHVEADDYRTLMRNTKMKDGSNTPDIHIRARQYGDSVTVEQFTETAARNVQGMTQAEARVLSILQTTFSEIGATASELAATVTEAGIARATFYNALNGLKRKELIEKRERRYFPSSKPVQEAAHVP